MVGSLTGRTKHVAERCLHISFVGFLQQGSAPPPDGPSQKPRSPGSSASAETPAPALPPRVCQSQTPEQTPSERNSFGRPTHHGFVSTSKTGAPPSLFSEAQYQEAPVEKSDLEEEKHTHPVEGELLMLLCCVLNRECRQVVLRWE